MSKTTVHQFLELKEKVDRLRSAADRAEGEVKASMDQLKKSMKCTTISEAKKELVTQSKEAEKLEQELEKELTAFLKKWGDSLNDN